MNVLIWIGIIAFFAILIGAIVLIIHLASKSNISKTQNETTYKYRKVGNKKYIRSTDGWDY